MRKKSSRKKQPKWKRSIKAGCLALGMATAWGGEAKADLFLQVSAHPTRTLTNAFVYYTGNNSIAGLESLGTLPADETTVLYRPIQGEENNYPFGHCVVVGLYYDGANPGVSVSFADDSVLTSHAQWADIFECAPVSHYNHSESEYIDALNQAAGGDLTPLWNCLYYRGSSPYPVGALFSNEGTLVNFSDPAFGGVVTAQLTTVPEPATWVLLIGVAGTLFFWRRDLLRG